MYPCAKCGSPSLPGATIRLKLLKVGVEARGSGPRQGRHGQLLQRYCLRRFCRLIRHGTVSCMSRKLRKPKGRFVQRLFAAAVTAQDLKKAIVAVNALPPEDRKDLTARSVALLRVFLGPPGQGSLSEAASEESFADSDRITAVQFRLEALARLSGHPKFRGWSMPSDKREMMFISDEVLEAAAKEPLLEDGNRPAFDPESFFSRLLILTEGDGTA